jgi:hypothetical protein
MGRPSVRMTIGMAGTDFSAEWRVTKGLLRRLLLQGGTPCLDAPSFF